MSIPQVVVDRELVEHSFREWQEEQAQLDAQLAESVEALDAYQSHLDNWQQDLCASARSYGNYAGRSNAGGPKMEPVSRKSSNWSKNWKNCVNKFHR